MSVEDHVDCCQQPKLDTVKSLYQGRHDCEALRQCQHCGAFWFYRYHEYVTFVSDDDDWTVWYSMLTDEDAKQIQEAQERPDLGFLAQRPGVMIDKEGVRKVSGQPSDPWY